MAVVRLACIEDTHLGALAEYEVCLYTHTYVCAQSADNTQQMCILLLQLLLMAPQLLCNRSGIWYNVRMPGLNKSACGTC
jgi:hypothetical protein